jgi:uncharacterized membrane protein YeaQ/YmgE (transglycosylase-associated protein family)
MAETVLYLLVVGLIAGFAARVVVRLVARGRNPVGLFGTVVLGVVGSFVGGFLGYALFNDDVDEGAFQTSGIVGSIIGAIIALLVYRAATERRLRRRHVVGRHAFRRHTFR